MLNEFPSWRSYWNFAHSVSRKNRYIRSPEVEAFLSTVQETSEARRVLIPDGRVFWRAQVGHGWRRIDADSDDEIPCALPRDRMKPLTHEGSDGRANPRGIPYLYLATTKEAAMSEVRPWIGSYVSVGQFKTTRPLTVIDCARRQDAHPIFFDFSKPDREPSPEQRSEAVWTHIDRAFSEPMTRADSSADYVSTQILAELFKSAGNDGVVYKSNFGDDSFNIALFDLEAAELLNCGLFEVKTVQLTFSEADQFYSLAR